MIFIANQPGEFGNIIYSSFFEPLIGKPTRITANTATLIDNIFTNVFDDTAACINGHGLLCADMSDLIIRQIFSLARDWSKHVT